MRPEVDGLQRAIGRMQKHLVDLAATPSSYMRAGFDLARTAREQQDLALRWAQDAAERAGVAIEGDATDA